VHDLQIARLDTTTKTAQDASGATIATCVVLQVLLILKVAALSSRRSWLDIVEMFTRLEDDVDAMENCKERSFPQIG
jgi:hypothetical protein